MTNVALSPTTESLTSMLRMLYGDDLVAEEKPADLGTPAVYAIYVDDDDTPRAGAECDLAFGAFSGASLTRIPKGGAEDAVDEGELPAPMYDNLREVMNILASLFMNDNTVHVRLANVEKSRDALPGSAQTMLESATGTTFEVEIPNYGRGLLRLVVGS